MKTLNLWAKVAFYKTILSDFRAPNANAYTNVHLPNCKSIQILARIHFSEAKKVKRGLTLTFQFSFNFPTA
jgi:hypothetical protein